MSSIKAVLTFQRGKGAEPNQIEKVELHIDN